MIADVLRVVSGPMAGVRGMRPETLHYEGEAAHLQEVWIAVRGALREVLEHVTLGQVLRGELPDVGHALHEGPGRLGHEEDMTRIHTDGACRGNPGPGGWAWALGRDLFASGAEAHTTNQRMEIRAVIEALREYDEVRSRS